jgi:ribosomal protein S18 acetylase RimI-like enzyme
LEPTNPSPPRPHGARPAFSLAFCLVLAGLIVARTATGAPSTPTVSRRLRLGEFSPPASRGVQRSVRPLRPVKRPEQQFRLTLATPSDSDVVLGLIEEARGWLRTQNTNQWAEPWPSAEERDARVLRGLENRKTWIVRDGDIPAATVTVANWHNPKVWVAGECRCDLTERAVYLHRLITARKYAGQRLGERLIDWATRRAQAAYRAKWARIDVWTTNTGLHQYYQNLGFEPCGNCPDPDYPSGALFQKPSNFRKEYTAG